MTQPAEPTQEQPNTEQAQPQQPSNLNEVTPEQWQAFVGALADQNNALQAQVNATQGRLQEISAKERREQLEGMSDKERADALQAQMNQLQQAGQMAQAQQISSDVWQRRDADAARRILDTAGLTGTEPELYRAVWDVNWMPRFAASVDAAVKARNAKANTRTNAADNPGNRANVGNGTGGAIPELDPNASGFDTIRFALQRGKG